MDYKVLENKLFSLKTNNLLEETRYDSMTFLNIAAHHTHLVPIYENYDINYPSHIFNMDETGFTSKLVTRKGHSQLRHFDII